jgi:predicted aldo/keto reductase-like oxidoreductase
LDKVRLGRTNLMVSRLGFGSIPIQRVPDDEAIAIIRRSLELGITYIDTANAYTTSEGRIGRAISDWRGQLVLSTKSQSRSPEGIAKHLQQSLEQLAVESIDLHQFHNVSSFDQLEIVLDPKGPMATLEKAKREGKIKHIGITCHQIDVAKAAVRSDRFETIMFPFNFVACEAADELIPLAKEHDVGFIAMKPLAGGMIDNATIAIKYLLQFPDVVPIPGIERIGEIEEIMGVVEGTWAMTPAEQREMERIRQESGDQFCRRCDYCQPCTAEIPISTVMAFPSMAKRMPRERLFSGFIADAMEKAANCTECGNCEERCPYHLPIMEMVARHVEWYETEKQKWTGAA